nr:peptidoglycan recognition family protein [Kibdelosporangium sp. MJ126-NF4]CEL16476.1 hypothetical protein [Kibdelosporangium sp. MJ126-NF4]CTQ90428.1 hypothetical protein [Kibdelosporangium sp. MJ126-NF4]
MAWCPFAVHKPINKKRSRIKPRAVILHTAVSSASSLFGYFSGVGDDSHFYIGPNGELEQYVDTEWSAFANRDANAFAISFESWDNRQIIPWTPAQVATLLRAVDWCCTTHGIPRRQIATTTGSGIGWHAMFGAPSAWTKAAGKVCPGGPRIDQTRNIIIPRVAGGQISEEDTLSWTENLTFTAPDGKITTVQARDWVMWTNYAAWQAANATARIEAAIALDNSEATQNQLAVMSAISDEPTQIDLTAEQIRKLLDGLSNSTKDAVKTALGESADA